MFGTRNRFGGALWIWPAALLYVAAGWSAAADNLPAPLTVPLISQKNFFWCWAASGSMVTAFYSRPVEQCRFVSDEVSDPHCCDTGQHFDVCNFASTPNFPRYHFAAGAASSTPLAWAALVSEIGAGRPFVFTMRGSPVNHMLVVRGVQLVPQSQVLLVNDPDGQLTVVTYDGYRNQHRATIQGISPLPVR
jgi:hypothetical protein